MVIGFPDVHQAYIQILNQKSPVSISYVENEVYNGQEKRNSGEQIRPVERGEIKHNSHTRNTSKRLQVDVEGLASELKNQMQKNGGFMTVRIMQDEFTFKPQDVDALVRCIERA